MTQKVLKEKLAKYLKLKEEKEKIEMEMKKIKKSLETEIENEIKLPYKEKFIKVAWVEQHRENIDRKLLAQKFSDIYRQVVKYYQVKYLDIKLVKK